MQWLTNWMMKEGPGIRKDEPKKTGLALFFSILAREPWELFKLNLLMLVLSIPVVTIPANFAAGCRICTLMIEDEVVFLWRDYWRAFARLGPKATGYGLVLALGLSLCGYAFFIYSQFALNDVIYIAPAVLAFFVFLFLMMVGVCLFALLAKGNMAPVDMVKAALVASLARPLSVIAGVGFAALLWLAHIVFYPASIFLPVVLNFSLGAFAMMFGAYRATDFALGVESSVNS
nr:hypothetical protein [uncultured Cohaesibacter sp.]